MTRRIIGLVYKNAFNALYGAAWMYAEKFRHKGYAVDIINLAEDGANARLEEEINSGEIAFCYAPQGVGSRLGADGVTLWEKKRMPFIGLHGDNPCYNIFNHISNTRYVANIYVYEFFAEINRRYINNKQIVESIAFQTDRQRPPTPFGERPIKLLYLKSNESTDECVKVLNGLAPALRDALWAQIDRARKFANFQICDLVQEVFDDLNINRSEQFDLFWGCAHWMDMYLRRQRAWDFADWLRRQEGAVIVGSGWDRLDTEGTRAIIKPCIDISEISDLNGSAQIICSTSPYGRDVLHERVAFGLMGQSIVISDTNAWWDKYFSTVDALKLFEWGIDLNDQLAPVLKLSLADAEEQASRAVDVTAGHFTTHPIADQIFDVARRIKPDALD